MVVLNPNLSSSNVDDCHHANGGSIIGREAIKEKGYEPIIIPHSLLEGIVQIIADSKTLEVVQNDMHILSNIWSAEVVYHANSIEEAYIPLMVGDTGSQP